MELNRKKADLMALEAQGAWEQEPRASDFYNERNEQPAWPTRTIAALEADFQHAEVEQKRRSAELVAMKAAQSRKQRWPTDPRKPAAEYQTARYDAWSRSQQQRPQQQWRDGAYGAGF